VSAREWMVEHLIGTVPLCMLRLDQAGHRPSVLLDTYEARVRAELARLGRELGAMAGGTEPQRTIPDIIGALSDAVLGGSKPGRGAAVGMAMSWGVAGAALLGEDGVTYAGVHWCARPHHGCPTPPPAPAVDDPFDLAAVMGRLDAQYREEFAA
jgi:hypothetical protein